MKYKTRKHLKKVESNPIYSATLSAKTDKICSLNQETNVQDRNQAIIVQ
jgi:hypothetical protein